MESYRIFLYIIFGILPSLVWLFYYLHKDVHPEPKRMILEIFIFGGLITIPVFFLQLTLIHWLANATTWGFFPSQSLLVEILKWFLIIALTEEVFKYLVVKFAVLRSKELDEPVDVMIYMVVSALGFAAVENILYLFSPINTMSFNVILQTAISITFIRFVGATFLHTLCSSIVGYFIALSCAKKKNRFKKAFFGIGLAVLLHGLYNFSIMTLQSPLNLQMTGGILIGLAVFMIFAYNHVKSLKSVCKI